VKRILSFNINNRFCNDLIFNNTANKVAIYHLHYHATQSRGSNECTPNGNALGKKIISSCLSVFVSLCLIVKKRSVEKKVLWGR